MRIFIAQLRSADFLKFDMGKVYMLICIPNKDPLYGPFFHRLSV